MTMAHLLEDDHISKYYGNIVALSDISTYVDAGEVTCILGESVPNGIVDDVRDRRIVRCGFHPNGAMEMWVEVDCGSFGCRHNGHLNAMPLKRYCQ